MLITINNKFTSDNEVNVAEGTENQYTLEQMKHYAKSRYLPIDLYKRNRPHLLREKGDVISRFYNNKMNPVGEQCSGDYVDISTNQL